MTALQRRIVSGFGALALQGDPAAKPPTSYYPRPSSGCPVNTTSNIKVNQNCLNLTDADLQGRGQANNETAIAVDPNNSNHLVAASNDYRRGDSNCFSHYSLDGGRTWTDTAIPMQFTRGFQPFDRQYWGGGGDPAVAWDTRGNAYMQCYLFNRGQPTTQNPDLSTAVFVYRSTKNFGASWNFPGRPVVQSNDTTGSGLMPLEDKPYMTVDDTVTRPDGSANPFRDRIYVTWTEFSANGTALIWESHSSDYGETFSSKVLVSTTSALCNGTSTTSTCAANQSSQPFTGRDGSLYVVWNNYNRAGASDNRDQVLLAKSTDGGVSFGSPVRVADYYELPDCATYQMGKNPGRSCVPEKNPATANSFFRASNYPVGGVNPTRPNQIVVTFGSYINRHSFEPGCVPTGSGPTYTGVKSPGTCNNDIVFSVSTNSGASFTGGVTDVRALPVVTQASGQATTDQFWQWAAFTPGGKLAVSYYDRQYGTDNNTGYSDFSLSGSSSIVTFTTQRVTSSSNPPPTQFAGAFMGDYTGLAVATNANPLWTDTRNPELFLCPATTPPATCTANATAPNNTSLINNDEDIYTANMAVPSG
jgi:hypothetical protein